MATVAKPTLASLEPGSSRMVASAMVAASTGVSGRRPASLTDRPASALLASLPADPVVGRLASRTNRPPSAPASSVDEPDSLSSDGSSGGVDGVSLPSEQEPLLSKQTNTTERAAVAPVRTLRIVLLNILRIGRAASGF
jgi:hypothetical protein